MDNLVYIVAGVIVLIIGGGAILRLKRAKKTREFAQSRGWNYEKSNATVIAGYPQLFPFSEGSAAASGRSGISIGSSGDGDARDVLSFTAGRYPGNSFMYTYTTKERDSNNESSSQNHKWHIVGLELPLPLPNITIRRRRKLDAIENKLTKPVEFPMPEFNAAYTVHSEHPPAAMDIITPDTASWLIAQGVKNKIVLEDNRIYTYAKGAQKPENIDPMLAALTGFLDRIPEVAWQKAQGEYPRPQRVRMRVLDIGQIAGAIKDYRQSKQQ